MGLLEKSPPSASSWGIHPWRAASVGYMKKKLEQSTSQTTGVGHVLVEVGRPGQEI